MPNIIKISSVKDRPAFCFQVGDEEIDGMPQDSFFDSRTDFHVVDGIVPWYPTFTQAHLAAYKLAHFMPFVVLAKKYVACNTSNGKTTKTASSVTKTGSFYDAWLAILQEQHGNPLVAEESLVAFRSASKAVRDLDKTEDRDALTSTLAGLKDVSDRETGSFRKEASVEKPVLSEATVKNVLFSYAATACLELERLNDHICVGNILKENDGYRIVLSDASCNLLEITANKDLLVNSIRPAGTLAKTYPYHSPAFYENIWEPLVGAIGHVVNAGVVLCPNLLPKNGRFMALRMENKKETVATVKTGATWMVKTADIMPPFAEKAMVECTNRNLPAYAGRTGVVVKVVHHEDYQDVTVDFGRGLESVVLSDKDIRPK